MTSFTVRDLPRHPSDLEAPPLVCLLGVLALVDPTRAAARVDALFSHSWSCVRLGAAGSAVVDLHLREQAAMVRVCLRGEQNAGGAGGYLEVYRGQPGSYRLTSDRTIDRVSIPPGADDASWIAAIETALGAAGTAPEAPFVSRWGVGSLYM